MYYVDSDQPKGTVVEMSKYGEYLPMIANLSIGISLGNIQATDDATNPPSPNSLNEDENDETEQQE